MKSSEKKIINLINNFNVTISSRPVTFGSIEDIEANFFLVDQIDMILKGHDKDYRELSWQEFLLFKGYGNKSASDAIRSLKVDNIYNCFSALRAEYFDWREAKILSISDSNNPKILKLLDGSNIHGATRLTSWFRKYPSSMAVEIYKRKIKNNFAKHAEISLYLSGIGDNDCISWAGSIIDNQRSGPESRCLAYKLIASSPNGFDHICIKEMIESSNTLYIACIIRGCVFSLSKDKPIRFLSRIYKRFIHNDSITTEIRIALKSDSFYQNAHAIKFLRVLGDIK